MNGSALAEQRSCEDVSRQQMLCVVNVAEQPSGVDKTFTKTANKR